MEFGLKKTVSKGLSFDFDLKCFLSEKQGWEAAESLASTEPPPPQRLNVSVAAMTSDRWDSGERKQQLQPLEKSKSYGREPADRPTFRTHQFNKSAQEREKKHSVASTLTTEKADTMEGKGFLFASASFMCCFFAVSWAVER